MRTARALVAGDPRQFGQRTPWQLEPLAEPRQWTVSSDVRLFASTFAVGFLFVSILIA